MKIDFKYNAAGKAVRLLVTETNYQTMMKYPGAVASTENSGTFTLPLDEIYVYKLQGEFGICSASVQSWVNERLARARSIVKILEQKDAPGDPRLYPFQRVDVQFMKEVPIVLNANEMGTGKTIEFYALVNEIKAQSVLVVCGKGKMQDWEDEGLKWVTGEKTFIQIKGTRSQKEQLLNTPSRFKIINYDSIVAPEVRKGKRIDLVDLWKLKFDIIGFDEAHRVKNKRAKRTNGAIRLASQAQRVDFMTGTPMVNAPQELFPIMSMYDPLRFTSYWTFVERFCQMEENPYASVPKIVGTKNLDHLQYILAPMMVQRKKVDVLPDLPDKIYKEIRIDLSPKQLKLYRQLKKEWAVEFDNGNSIVTLNTVSQMVRLRQICCTPLLIGADYEDSTKTEAFLELVDEFIETEEKLIVFSFFKSYLIYLSDILTKKKIAHVLTTGETSSKVRESNKQKFEHDPSCNIFMITTETGGEGLNLQYAHNVLFLDRPWTPAAMHQAEDRVHRMGQVKSPLIMSFTCRKTVEEYIKQVVDTKDEMITEAMAIQRVVQALLAEED